MPNRGHLTCLALGLGWIAPSEDFAKGNSGTKALHEQGTSQSLGATRTLPAGNGLSIVHHRANSWHFDIGVRSSHPRLQETQDMLRKRLDAPLKLDFAHVFSHPYTPIDRNTDFGFGSGFIGLGRQESDWLIWNVYVGGNGGEDRSFDRFLVTTLEVNFKYRCFFLGGDLEIYPWKIPESHPGMSVGERFHAGRPYILTGIEAEYIRADGEGTFRIFRLPVYHDEEHVRDWTGNYFIGLGWSVPLSDSISWNIAGNYAFSFSRPDEYNGWNLMTGLRFRF